MTQYVRTSGSSLFTLSWESKKSWHLVEGIGDAASNGIKRKSKSTIKKVLDTGKLLTDVATISYSDVIKLGLGLVSTVSD